MHMNLASAELDFSVTQTNEQAGDKKTYSRFASMLLFYDLLKLPTNDYIVFCYKILLPKHN